MIKNDRECFICKRQGPLHVHHTLHGSYRKMADKYGLTVYLCPECHRDLHDKGTFDRELQEIGQRYFEEQYGHEEFMRVFGKNFKEV